MKDKHVLKMLSSMLHSWCMMSVLCIKISALAYGSSHNAHLWVQLYSFPYPTNSSPFSLRTKLSSILVIFGPLKCLGSPSLVECVDIQPKWVIQGQKTSMTIKVRDLPPKFKVEIRCVLHTYRTCQNSIATPY
jgi:hypothetical protein